jgi:hypothetical protein
MPMPTGRSPEPKGPDWTPEKTLRVLRLQYAELEKIKSLPPLEAYKQKAGWTQVTQAAITHGFGEQSQNLTNFHFARYHARNKDQWADFRAVTEAHETALTSAIRELEFMVPEAEMKSAYDSGDEFSFYVDLKNILASAAEDVFVVDNYLNADFFELYVVPIPKSIPVRIVTDAIRGNVEAVAKKYATRGKFELRSSKEVHDRHVFVDGRGWMIGQSIKDAAKKKPTYMVEIGASAVAAMQGIYEAIWSRATTLVKS